jgi:hypothetical protein
MVQTGDDLRQLKGIGKILVQRLQDAGLDSFAKIAEAGEEKLKEVSGINPRNIASILEQAKQLAETSPSENAAGIETLQLRLGEVKQKIQTLAETARERFQEELAGKWGKKLSADLVRIEDALERINFEGKKGSRRAGKALGKVDKRVSGLAGDASLKKVRKTLKRARKAVKKAVK